MPIPSDSNKISPSTAIIIALNAMIGAAIFTIPNILSNGVGPAGILSFVFMGFACWIIGLSLARVAQLYPQEGSFYTYSRPWAGHVGGMIASASYLVGIIIAMGLLTHAAGNYLHHYFPDTPEQTLSLVTLILIIIFNIAGVSLSTAGQRILFIATLFPIFAIITLCIPHMSLAHLTPFAPFGLMSIFKSTRIAAFAFFGFESVASLFTILKNPEKNLPRVLSYSLAIVAILYVAFISTLMLAVPSSLFQQYPNTLTVPLSIILPNHAWLIEAIHFASIAAILGTVHAMVWSSGVFLLSLFKRIRNIRVQHLIANNILNEKTSIMLVGCAIYGSFRLFSSESFFYYTAIFMLSAYAMALITLLTLPAEWKSKRNYITVASLLAILLVFWFALQGIIGN